MIFYAYKVCTATTWKKAAILKENTQILVSRSYARRKQSADWTGVLRGGGGGEGMGYKRVGNGYVSRMEIIYKNNLVNLLSQV